MVTWACICRNSIIYSWVSYWSPVSLSLLRNSHEFIQMEVSINWKQISWNSIYNVPDGKAPYWLRFTYCESGPSHGQASKCCTYISADKQKKGTDMAPLESFWKTAPFLLKGTIGTKTGPQKARFYGWPNGSPRELFWCHLFFLVHECGNIRLY